MSDRMLKVKACEHPDTREVFSYGEDAPGKSQDTLSFCNTCGALIHDYRHNGGQKSPNYPVVYESPMLGAFLSVCQQLIDTEREARADKALINKLTDICPDCPADVATVGCETCDGSGVVPKTPRRHRPR